MEKGKHERRKVQIFEKYSVLILIATMLMSIGYAEITGVDLSVTTNVESTAQDGVFITDITRTEYDGADITASKINSYIDTTVNSTVVLGGNGSYITYNVSVYNKTDREQVFIGPFSITGEGLYDNSLITYELGGLVPYETILQPGKNSYFTITFKYAGNDTSNNTLTSKINFRFMEVPELAITSEGEITGIFPGYTPQEYEFTVSNYTGEIVNNVALSYGLTAEIQKPFIAKIYDANGTEVTSDTAIDIAGTATKVDHTYKLKIIWDNTNTESGVVYNNVDYANKTYKAKINVIAKPKANSEGINKYENYQLTQAKDITVKTAPLYFTAEPNNTTIEMTNNRGEINLAVSNNDGSAYNPYETKYTISQDNTKYTLHVDEVEYANNITGERTIGTGEKITLVEKIWLVPKTGVTLNKEETAKITINITSPYTQTKNIQINITDTTPPSAPTITGGSESFTTAQTISVSKVATDVGTGVQNYEYLVNNTGQAIADASGNVGSTEAETSKTFDTDYNGYYIWFRAVDKVGNVGEWSNSQQLNIDTTGPSAPTIKGGNSSYDTTSLTISVNADATDSLSGVAYYEYYKTTSSTEPTEDTNATGAIGTTATEKSKTFSENIEGEYIYFRAIDKVGNKGIWSTAQRMYIDINKPIVSAKSTATAEVEEKTNTELSTYFNTDKNGNAGITSTVYTDTSNSNAVVANTSTLAVGTHVIRCKVTKENGLTNYADKTIKIVKAGPKVNSSGLATENFTIKPSASSNVQIVIPTGWAPAKLTGSGGVNSNPGQNGAVSGILLAAQWNSITVDQINKGIVIVNGTSDFEEYVWVPIPDSSSFARKAWTTLCGYSSTGAWIETGVKHSLAETSTANYFWEDKTKTEYKNMVSSVTTNKGFYVGRYEASQKSSTVAQSKRAKTAWGSVTQSNAITYSANSSINNSHLIYGIEWDSILNWIIGKAVIGTSTSGKTKTMELSDIQDNSCSWGNYANATGNAATNAGTQRTTGYSEYWKANNIYDMAGNMWEWTQEKWGTGNYRTFRSGSYAHWGHHYAVATREIRDASENWTDLGIRVCFFI